MPAIQIIVRLGDSTKSFTGTKRLISVGRSTRNDLVLPFPFVQDDHLLIENNATGMRIRTMGTEARATAEGKAIGGSWVAIASPGHVEIPTSNGNKLRLDVMWTEPRLSAMILRDAEAAPQSLEGAGGVSVLSQSRLTAGKGYSDGNFAAADMDASNSASPPTAPWWASRRVTIPMVGGIYVVLIVGALAFNRVQIAKERQRLADDTQFVSAKIESANNLIRSGNYSAAKSDLDAAEPVAKRVPQLADALADIGKIRAKPEIQYGATGYVLVGDQWILEQTAKEMKAQRERDDPKIAELERSAAENLAAGKYDDALSACQQALALMRAETAQPHPREAAVTAQIDRIKNQSISASMTAKGLVLYDGRWITPDEKFKLEQKAKGLELYDGQWMNREQIAEAKDRAAQGLVLYDGKWMTPDQKKEAQGLVKFEGEWVKAADRDATLAKRKAEEVAQKAEQARADSQKKIAYSKSQFFLREKEGLPASAHFPEFDSDKVTVVEDQGWFIVQGVVTLGGENGKAKTYYCKLRPKSVGTEWEADATSFAE